MLSTFLNPISPLGKDITNLFWIWVFISAVIFLIVTTWVLWAIIKFRERPGGPPPRKTFGSNKIEILWTIGPLLTVFFLIAATIWTMIKLDPPSGDTKADLVITGHQWWWEIHYPESGVLTANEVHLQSGKKYLVQLTSGDVIHDFWAPSLGRKMDAIPGRDNYFYMEAAQPGVYRGFCSEYCGTQHAGMRITVVVQEEEAFKNWEKIQLVVPPPPTGGKPAEGARLFANKTCYNCHTIAGTGADMSIGPDLTHVSTRLTLGAGVLKNSPENLHQWLQDPAQFKPGSHMPNLQLEPHEVEALVAYLESLK